MSFNEPGTPEKVREYTWRAKADGSMTLYKRSTNQSVDPFEVEEVKELPGTLHFQILRNQLMTTEQNAGKLRKAIREAASNAELDRRESRILRLGLFLPRVRRRLIPHLLEALEEEKGEVSSMSEGDIIKWIIEHLDEILAFILAIIDAIS
jgi:hypothetical protein